MRRCCSRVSANDMFLRAVLLAAPLSEWVFYEQVVAIGLPQVLGAVSAAVSARSVATWYRNDVRKPKWHPPLPLFGAIWPVLYFLIGFASYVVYVEAMGVKRYAGPLTLYALQLMLNIAWQPLFFEVRNWRLAQLDNIGTHISCSPLSSIDHTVLVRLAYWKELPKTVELLEIVHICCYLKICIMLSRLADSLFLLWFVFPVNRQIERHLVGHAGMSAMHFIHPWLTLATLLFIRNLVPTRSTASKARRNHVVCIGHVFPHQCMKP